jgi:biopolymer transport protein ExbD
MSVVPNDDLLLEDEAPVSTGGRKEPDSELDITPMIDIVFLLLIFFVVTSKMQPQQVTDLPKARHGEGIASKQWIVLNVKRSGGDVADITRKDGSAFSSDKEEQAQQIEDYVKEGLDQGMKLVVIRAEGAVKTGEISRIRTAISAALEEGQEINIAVQEQ